MNFVHHGRRCVSHFVNVTTLVWAAYWSSALSFTGNDHRSISSDFCMHFILIAYFVSSVALIVYRRISYTVSPYFLFFIFSVLHLNWEGFRADIKLSQFYGITDEKIKMLIQSCKVIVMWWLVTVIARVTVNECKAYTIASINFDLQTIEWSFVLLLLLYFIFFENKETNVSTDFRSQDIELRKGMQAWKYKIKSERQTLVAMWKR